MVLLLDFAYDEDSASWAEAMVKVLPEPDMPIDWDTVNDPRVEFDGYLPGHLALTRDDVAMVVGPDNNLMSLEAARAAAPKETG